MWCGLLWWVVEVESQHAVGRITLAFDNDAGVLHDVHMLFGEGWVVSVVTKLADGQ